MVHPTDQMNVFFKYQSFIDNQKILLLFIFVYMGSYMIIHLIKTCCQINLTPRTLKLFICNYCLYLDLCFYFMYKFLFDQFLVSIRHFKQC
jgi:hypothetical protein